MAMNDFLYGLTQKLAPERRQVLKGSLKTHRFRWFQHLAYRAFFGSDLKKLARVYNTDKWGTHFLRSALSDPLRTAAPRAAETARNWRRRV